MIEILLFGKKKSKFGKSGLKLIISFELSFRLNVSRVGNRL